ncbi:hypothetical protein HY345_01660 [Candidatus Microgenomates bacterium]|nr:hypothetical protein [Candidatus Microgenomates bacterium]
MEEQEIVIGEHFDDRELTMREPDIELRDEVGVGIKLIQELTRVVRPKRVMEDDTWSIYSHKGQLFGWSSENYPDDLPETAVRQRFYLPPDVKPKAIELLRELRERKASGKL